MLQTKTEPTAAEGLELLVRLTAPPSQFLHYGIYHFLGHNLQSVASSNPTARFSLLKKKCCVVGVIDL